MIHRKIINQGQRVFSTLRAIPRRVIPFFRIPAVSGHIFHIYDIIINVYNMIYRYNPRWMEFLGSTAPIPANMLAERVGTKTESHGLET
jgi:hypothetical protein